MTLPKFHPFGSKAELTQALVVALERQLDQAIEERGRARMVVSGGRTPERVFGELSALRIDWSKVGVTLADERWVPLESAQSNEAFVNRTLLQGPAASAQITGLYTGEVTPEEGRLSVESRLREFGRPFDVVHLGMGGDGHFASLFPNDGALNIGLDLSATSRSVAATAPDGSRRISQTLSALLDSHLVVLHIEGEQKRAVYERACQPGVSDLELPIAQLIRQAGHRLQVYWAP